MLSADFQKYIRDMSHIGNEVEIIQKGNMLSMKVKGDCATWEKLIMIGENTGGQDNDGASAALVGSGGGAHNIPDDGENHSIFQGRFKIRPLVTFTKCSQLSTRFEILLKNKFAIILTYKVADLGEIRLCLAPEVDDENTAVAPGH